MSVDDIELAEKVATLKASVETEAARLLEEDVLPRVLEISNYKYGDARIVAHVDSSDEELLNGKLNVGFNVVFDDKYPDPFQIAQRIITQEMLNVLLMRR